MDPDRASVCSRTTGSYSGITIGMCFGLVVLLPRGDVSGSSKTSAAGGELALVTGCVDGLPRSRSAVCGEFGMGSVPERARLLEASALDDSDF